MSDAAIAQRPSEYYGLDGQGIEAFERRWDALVEHAVKPNVPYADHFRADSEIISQAETVTDLDLLRRTTTENIHSPHGLYQKQLLGRMMFVEMWPDTLGAPFGTTLGEHSSDFKCLGESSVLPDIALYYEQDGKVELDLDHIGRVMRWGLDVSPTTDAKAAYMTKIGLRSAHLLPDTQTHGVDLSSLPINDRIDLVRVIVPGNVKKDFTEKLVTINRQARFGLDELDAAIIERAAESLGQTDAMVDLNPMHALQTFLDQDPDNMFTTVQALERFRYSINALYGRIARIQDRLKARTIHRRSCFFTRQPSIRTKRC